MSNEKLITFLEKLRSKNLERLPKFKDAHGRICHNSTDGSDWKLSQWSNAVGGEFGEMANLIKKLERGDFTIEEIGEKILSEIADQVIYLDILAAQVQRMLNKPNETLEEPITSKFNTVSIRIDEPQLLI